MNLENISGFPDDQGSTIVMGGHDNTFYNVGGNAADMIRNITTAWKMNKPRPNSLTIKKDNIYQLEMINMALNLPKHIYTEKTIYKILHRVMALPCKDFIKFFETSFSLNESIIIQLRRLFYILSNKHIPSKSKKFCHLNPKKCILDLLNSIDLDAFGKRYELTSEAELKIKNAIFKIDEYLEDRDLIEAIEFDISTAYTNITEQIALCFECLIDIAPHLTQIEELNINISKNLENINNIFEHKMTKYKFELKPESLLMENPEFKRLFKKRNS